MTPALATNNHKHRVAADENLPPKPMTSQVVLHSGRAIWGISCFVDNYGMQWNAEKCVDLCLAVKAQL